jgi:glycosyltransferase involved in cell wall biosynthesis
MTGACRELAEDAAQYVDPLDPEAIGNAMVDLDRAQDLRQRMRSAGLKRATEFTWRRTAERTLMVLTSVMSAAS